MITLPRNVLILATLAAAALSIFLSGCAQTPPPYEHQITVEEASSGDPVTGAKVTAAIGLRNFFKTETGPDGTAQISIDPESAELHTWTKLTVEADGFDAQSLLVNVGEEEASVVQLRKPGEEAATAETETGTNADTTAEQETGGEEATGEEVEPVAEETEPEAIETEESETPSVDTANRTLADVAPADRANYYSAKPEVAIDTDKTYRATIQTSKGDIVVSLDAQAAPEHVNNFIFLSNEGFYDGLNFHRVEPGFVIQGGDPQGSGQGGPGYTVPGEFDLKHIEGALAMARLSDAVNPERESSGSQFYITLAPTPFLDDQYSVFGNVEEGMDVVKAIEIGDMIEQVIIEE